MRLTVLSGQSSAQRCDISVYALRLLLCKLRDIIPVPLECISNVVCGLRIAELQDGIVVERPILSLLVFSPYLLTLDTEDLHANTARRRCVVRNDLWC